MQTLWHRFEEGGCGMYLVVLILGLVVALSLRHLRALWLAARAPEEERLAIQTLRGAGSMEAALAVMAIHTARENDVAQIERRLGTFVLLAKLAFFAGVLGTVIGTFIALGPVCSCDAASTATMFAKGFAEAMNCTAFGLLTAMFARGSHHLLERAAGRAAEHVSARATAFQKQVDALRPFLRLDGRPPPEALRTYRGPTPAGV